MHQRRPAPRTRTARRPASGATVLAGALTVCATLAGCSSNGHGAAKAGPQPVVSAYVSAWTRSAWSAMSRLVERPPADFQTANAAPATTLGLKSESFTAGSATVRGTRATAPVTEHLQLALYGSWTVHTTLHLRMVRGHWKVVWTPATINPAFGSSGAYSLAYTWPQRAPILAANGTPISSSAPTTVVIGLEGHYLKNPAAVAASLEQAGATTAETNSAVAAAQANPSAFQAVFTVPWARYQQLQPTLEPIPGVFFQSQGGSGSTPPALASVVGSMGTITKAQLKAYGAPYTATSVVGTSGLEQAYERQLAGRPGATIGVANGSGSGTSDRVLKTFPAKAGKPVRTTIDMTVETAAASALASPPGDEAALVAIQASTGKVLAVVNSSTSDDLALEGNQPPGSTMKVITSTALIKKGLTPQSPATCPPTINVDGENFHNAGDEGSVPNLMQAFTVSCNTAFIGLAVNNLNYSSLHDAADLYRIGSKLRVGMPVFSGSVPVDNGQTDFAAAAIGQARVVMNPFDLAMVAADIDTSKVRTPWIVDGAPAEHEATAPLPTNLVSDLHQMMLSVVLNGTASGTGLPPGTYGKTGTAEYGSGNPLPLDGWLMGFNGDIAFAMIDVNAPGDGGPTDGPIVAKFLNALGAAK